jgi:hypothetical protein
MIKRAVLMILAILVFSGSAMAERGSFGLGVIVGEPTGITAKYFLDNHNAIDGGFGWSLNSDHDFHLYADYLYHVYFLTDVGEGELPLYFGVGGRFVYRDDKDNQAGIRVPVGLNYILASAPIGFFAEIVPILDLAPDVDLDLEGGVGFRYYF